MKKNSYRDMEKFKNTIRRQQKRYYDKTKDAKNTGNYWSKRDIKLVMEHKMTDTELSALLGRSVKAIQIKRSREKAKNDN